MTLGQAPEALAIGYLRNQRLVASVDEIAEVQVDWETDAVAVTTRTPLQGLEEKMKKRTVTTGCGQGTVFGDLMEEIDSIRLRDDVQLTEETLYGLLDAVRRHETIYKSAGAVHGCALAAGTEILHFVEDVGRHNAVDAIAGLMWLEGIDGSDKIFYTTGRLTSEMVIKAAQMRFPSSSRARGSRRWATRSRTRIGITMIGRAVNKHYLLFTGKHRFVKTVDADHARLTSPRHGAMARQSPSSPITHHRGDPGRRPGPAHGRRGQRPEGPARQADGGVGDRALRAAGRRGPDQRQSEPRRPTGNSATASSRTRSAASPVRSPDCTAA